MKWYRQRGFSIIEVMIAVSILTFVIAALYNLFNSQYRSFEAQRDVTITQRDIRASLSMLERDIRMAGLGVPRGSNPVGALQNGILGDPNAPDSISINYSTGTITYLTSAAVTQPNNVIQVRFADNFSVGDTINIVNNENNNLVGEYGITAVDAANDRLSLNADPSADGINTGDFVVREFRTVAYSVVLNLVTGRQELIRNDGIVASTIIDGVVNFQLRYTLNNGTEVDVPANLADIRRVRIDLLAQTIREAAQLGDQQIPRELVTVIPIKNVRI